MRSLEENGYAIALAMFSPIETASIEESLKAVPIANAGTRNLLEFGWCRVLVNRIRSTLGLSAVSVQCTLFAKTLDRNWLVAPHQDLSIPVREGVDHPELRAWSMKEGQLFVQPPAALLEQLIAVRLHVDDCGAENGPLRVVPKSHLRGRLNAAQAQELRDALGEVSLPVNAGDALLLKPLTVHASSKASSPKPRRVLHFVFGPTAIGYGLRWRHAV